MANKSDIQKCDTAIASLSWEITVHPSLFDTIAVGQTETQALNGKTEFTAIQVYGYYENGEEQGAQSATVTVVNRKEAERLSGESFWFYGE